MFNWLRQAAGAVGNLFNQGSRYVGNTFNNADRQRRIWEQQARQAAPQVQRQVQQQVQQLPKPPQVDFSAVIKNLQALRNQPQVNNAIRAANPINQFKSQANAIQKGLNQPIPGLGVSQRQIAAQLPMATKQTAMGAKKVGETFFGGTGQVLNTAKSLVPGSVVLTVAPYEIAGKALGIKPLEDRARQVRNQAFADYSKQSQTGVIPMGSQVQKDIDSGGIKGLKAFTGTMFNKGTKAGLEIAPVVTGTAAGVPIRTALLRGGTTGAAGNFGYSMLNDQYKNKTAQEKALQFALDVGGGYGGELLGAGIGKLAGKVSPKTIQQGKSYTGNLLDEMNTKFRQGKIDEKQFRAFVVDDFTKKNGRMPMPADVDSFVDVATGRMNRPYVEALRQKYAGNQPQLPVGTRIADTAPKNPLDALKIEDRLKSKYPGVDFSVYDNGRTINVSKIVVPKTARNSGIGTKAMQEIISEADRSGKTITLTPSSDYGGSKVRLKEFYKRLGFVENKGRTKDLAISEDMYRLPTNKSQGVRDSLADGLPNPGRKPIISDADPLEALKAEARQATGARSDYSPENLQANRQIRAKNASSITYADKKAIKPDELVTVYRAVPGKAKGGLTEGDWVTPNKEQARLFMKQSWAQDDTGAKIVTKKVKASELRYHADDAKGYVDDELLYVPKSDPLEALKQEARKYKSAEEFVKAQGESLYHGGSKLDKINNMRSKWGAIYATENPTYAKSFGGKNSVLNEVVVSKDAKLADLRKPSKELIDQITSKIDEKLSKAKPYDDKAFSLYPYSRTSVIDGIKQGKGHIAELPEVKQVLKELGYDGQITKEVPFASNYGVWNKNKIQTKQQLTDLYNQAKNKPIYELAPKPDAQVPVKASGISKSLQKSGSEIYADIPGYIPVKNKALLNISENRVANNERAVIDSIVNRQPNQPITPQMNADSVYLLNKLLKEGRDEEALAIAKATAKNATSAGRAVQILSRLQQTTPEGALVKAQKVVNEVNAKAKKQIATLDAKKQEDIIALANEVQKYKPDTRDWQVAAGKLAKYIENLKPVTKGAKISMVQTMGQLLNPKTAIRNIVGNLGMSGGEDIASIPATLLDKMVSKKTGIRTTAISNPIVGIKGAIKGAKYGIEDTKLGIKTLGGASKFDVRPDVFKKGVMKKLQNALGYELGVPDKAFYQSAFDKTLDSTMRANKTKTPTAEMLDIANSEALYATFQNNSAIGNALQKTKSVLNANQEFGAGDFIIKYPKTPGNIVSVGLDYSPVGMAKGITSLARNFDKMTPAVQREAVRNIGRGITGTGAIAMGVILAKNNIITGRKDSDTDIAALDREQGMGPFSFNATALQRFVRGEDTKARPGDVIANYDWLQPAAIQLSMGANAVINAGKSTDIQLGDLAESIGDSVNTIVEQPVLQGVSQFVNNLNTKQGGGLGKALSGVVSGIPSSFVPGSVNQIGQFMDNTARSTYSPKTLLGLPVGEMVNKTKARIPVLRESLQPAITTLGQPREQYQDGSNNIFNVFFNPAFIKTIKDNEVYELVKGIQDRSGETQQAPRVVDKKITINGQEKKLTSEEYAKYQTYVGQKTNQAFSNLANDQRFNSLSDEDKAKYMSGKLTDINAAAKSELFGNESTAGADRIKTGELGYETAEDRKAKNRKPKATKTTKSKKGKTAKAKKGRKAKVAKLPSIRLSAPRKVAIARVAKLRSPKVSYPRLAKSSKMPKIKV